MHAKLRLCEGHAARTANRLNEAKASFAEVVGTLPVSPNARLGLAHVYAQNARHGADEATLKEAERLGYVSRYRDIILFGEAYRTRGNLFLRESREGEESGRNKAA